LADNGLDRSDTLGEHGNTSAACVPLALDVGIRDGRIKPKDVLLFEAFGGGLTWGSALALAFGSIAAFPPELLLCAFSAVSASNTISAAQSEIT
jgi:hypothetical protein